MTQEQPIWTGIPRCITVLTTELSTKEFMEMKVLYEKLCFIIESFAGKDKVLYGDTDSIYLVTENDAIIREAHKSCGARLEVDRRWKVLFLTPNKKQYYGLTSEGDLVQTTLTGMKSDQRTYFGKVVRKLISKEFLKSFISGSSNPLDAVVGYLRF